MNAVTNLQWKSEIYCAGGVSGSDLPDTNSTKNNKPDTKQKDRNKQRKSVC